MTVLNVWITRESVLLGTDTQVVDANGLEKGHITKFFAMPHIDAVVSHRGDGFFFQSVVAACSCWVGDFDGLSDQLGNALPAFLAQTKKTAATVGIRPPGDAQSVVLAGWSTRSGRMVGREWIQHTPEEGFVIKDIEAHIAPHDESLKLFADPSTIPAMEQLVRAQVRLIKNKVPGAAGGGHLLMCQMSRGTMAMARGVEL